MTRPASVAAMLLPAILALSACQSPSWDQTCLPQADGTASRSVFAPAGFACTPDEQEKARQRQQGRNRLPGVAEGVWDTALGLLTSLR